MAKNFSKLTLFSEKANFKEDITIDPASGTPKRNYMLTSRIVPFERVSRNGYMYNTESIKNTAPQLIGKHLMFNHKTNGAWEESKPRGEWKETWIEDDGMWGKAQVYDVSYNKEFLEFLQAASEPRVSLNVNGVAEQRTGADGSIYSEAIIAEWLESSVVSVPGFDMAKSSFAMEMMKFNESYAQENEEFLQIIELTRQTSKQLKEDKPNFTVDEEEGFFGKLMDVITNWGNLFKFLGVKDDTSKDPAEPIKK